MERDEQGRRERGLWCVDTWLGPRWTGRGHRSCLGSFQSTHL